MTRATGDFLTGQRVPKVYVYTTPQFANTSWSGGRIGAGLVKVGFTTRDVHARIREQVQTASPLANPYTLLLERVAITDCGVGFNDHDVHRVLERHGFTRLSGEWFEATVDEVEAAIREVSTGKPVDMRERATHRMRPEQALAVAGTAEFFRANSKQRTGKAPHFLWNAKMRFGKTFATYQLALEMGWRRILVLTYKPAAQTAWKDDLLNHADFEGWQFIGNGDTFSGIDETRPFVWFASFQDVLGRKDGQVKERLEELYLADWDAVVLDEYHFGAWRASAKDLYDAEPTEKSELDDCGFAEDGFPLTVNHYLYLSGTPFRALTDGEFVEDQVFNWTYADEQAAKEAWNPNDGPNPYADLPRMVLMTYKMPDELRRVAAEGEFNEFDLNTFFKTEEIPGEKDRWRFVHEQDVQKWLGLLRGQHLQTQLDALASRERPPLPFDDRRLLDALRHTLWFLPNVGACYAMADLLQQPANVFFHEYTIIVAAGKKTGNGAAALPPVIQAIGSNPLGTRSITLTCGKLTTGVTVPPWTGIFMLRQTSSPETYFQAAFRVQSPWTLTHRNPDGTREREVLKDTCYVFDFAPNRALRQIAEYSGRLTTKDTSTPEEKVAEFVRFLPVLCYDGSSMTPLNAADLLDVAHAGTSSSMLARRWQSASLVNLNAATLDRLLAKPDVIAALEQMESFRNLSKDVTQIIAAESAINKAKREQRKPSPDETKVKTDADRRRKEIRDNLIKFVARVPVFMYLTDDRESALKDLITTVEPELFTRATGLEVADFLTLADVGVFNSQTLNSAIWAFKRFEESSLTYAGGRTLEEQVGLFDRVGNRHEDPSQEPAA